MSLPRVLLVTSRFPYPVIAGDRLRIFNLTRQLARQFRVTLVALDHDGSAAQAATLREQTGIEQVIAVPHTRRQAVAGALGALVRGEPLQAGYYASPALKQTVEALLPQHDAAIFHLIRTSGIWQRQAAVPSVLEMCDAISANFEQTMREGRWTSPWRWVSRIEAPRTARYERSEIGRFDLVTMHTQVDADRVGIPRERLLVSTQGTDTRHLVYRDPGTRTGQAIALIGKMDFFPNRHGAEWFAAHVLPLLPERMTLKLVGDCSPQLRERLGAIPRVTVTGRVDSIDAACADCFAAVAPMHVATGIQNKVLEYFAMGLPAVVSPSVARGLLAPAKGGYHVAGSGREWADALLAIDRDRDAAMTLARHARQYVDTFHSWDRIGADYCARLQSLITASGTAGPQPERSPQQRDSAAV